MHTISHAVILFLDVRGFTSWSQHVDVHQYLEEFLSACYTNVQTVFEGAFIKTLGDGAMIIQECPIPTVKEEVTELLATLLFKMCQVESHFRETCDMFAWQRGHQTELRLGWGVTRGIVLALSNGLGFVDYIGPNINKSARLCSLARPSGIVIDREDFPTVPPIPDDLWGKACPIFARAFLPEEHQVNGITDTIHAWTLLTDEAVVEQGHHETTAQE